MVRGCGTRAYDRWRPVDPVGGRRAAQRLRRLVGVASCVLAGWLAGSGTAVAAPLVSVPVTVNVGAPVTVTLEQFPSTATVDVFVRPSGGGNCCGVQVANDIVTDAAGRATVSFVWPERYESCRSNENCTPRAWQLGGLADVDATVYGRTLVGNANTTRVLAFGAPGPDLTLAQRFRPVLAFDSSERWRPLEIDRLFARETPGLCAIGCHEAFTPASLTAFGIGADARLDMAGVQTDADSYRSPLPECRANGLLDCDGPDTAIYVHDVVHEGYRYMDYWWFLRFNHAPFTKLYYGEHEGDWEGMTVAVPASAADLRDFDFVAIAAHEGVFRYLRDALHCHEPATGGEVACASGGPQRVKVFVADGTHAGYPRACRKILALYCRQTGSVLPEKGFDGARPWGANDDPTALKSFGPAWASWGGNWNSETEPRVNSPARQGRHRAPWQVRCDTRWSLRECGGAAASRVGAADCAVWFGPFVAAAACDPVAVRAALRTGSLAGSGALRIAREGAASAAAPGLAQAVGDALEPGSRCVWRARRARRPSFACGVRTRVRSSRSGTRIWGSRTAARSRSRRSSTAVRWRCAPSTRPAAVCVPRMSRATRPAARRDRPAFGHAARARVYGSC